MNRKTRMKILTSPMILLLLTLAGCVGSSAPPLSEAEKLTQIETLYAGYKESFVDVPDVTVAELIAMDAEDVVLVDVRKRSEQAVSMIPGAITRQDFEANFKANPEAWQARKIVTYCTVGYRSGLYAAGLREKGLDAVNLVGSLLAWTHADQPLTNAEGPTQRLHVFGATWNLAADGYEPVW